MTTDFKNIKLLESELIRFDNAMKEEEVLPESRHAYLVILMDRSERYIELKSKTSTILTKKVKNRIISLLSWKIEILNKTHVYCDNGTADNIDKARELLENA